MDCFRRHLVLHMTKSVVLGPAVDDRAADQYMTQKDLLRTAVGRPGMCSPMLGKPAGNSLVWGQRMHVNS